MLARPVAPPTTVQIVFALQVCKYCVSLNGSKRRGKFRGRRRGALERSQGSVDRTVPSSYQGYGLTRSADRASERADQLPDDAPQVPRKRPRIPPRVDHDGKQTSAFAGLSEPPRPGSVPRDC